MKSSDEIETTENKVVKKVVVYAVMVALVFYQCHDGGIFKYLNTVMIIES